MNSIKLILKEVAYRCHFYCQEERFPKSLMHLHLATSHLTEVGAVCTLSCNNSLVSHMKLGHYHSYRKMENRRLLRGNYKTLKQLLTTLALSN